jgi:outer membrane protein TolC
MKTKQLLYLLLAAFLLGQSFALSAQEIGRNRPDYSVGPDAFPNFLNVFKVPEVPEVSLANSGRLDELLRQGTLYLSLDDALALAIENNLDLAVARYNPMIAETDLLRTKSGQQLRGVQTQISTLSTGTSVGGGAGGGGEATGVTGRAGGGGGGGGGGQGDAASFFGTQSVNLDPVLFGNIDWGHTSSPQASSFVVGSNVLILEDSTSSLGIRQGFVTGATASLVYANRLSDSSSINANLNPTNRANLTLTINQPLLRGFGKQVNTRNIIVAKRNQQITDLAFKAQVQEVVTRVTNIYWDLVSLRAAAASARESLELAQKLYQDNTRRVEIGTLAAIEVVRAEAEVAAREEEVTIADTRVRLQETVFKNAISVNGMSSPSLVSSRIMPTDTIQVPTDEQLGAAEELMQLALSSRPDIEQSRLQLGNTDINLKAIRNARLPNLTLSLDFTNNGLAGQINPVFTGSQIPSEFFLGGRGTALDQIFTRNFPDYRIGLNLSVPLRNRQAQADLAATLLQKRQAEIGLTQTSNSIRLEVQNAMIGVEQARARYNSATKTVVLQQRTLEAEQKKFDLGASTIFLVVQAQRDLAIARSQEIAAQNSYVVARTALDQATGQILEAHNISLEEAVEGVVHRPSSPLPPN